MNNTMATNKTPILYKLGEMFLVLSSLVYFLTYPRNTISDFIVLTALCFLLMFLGPKIGLTKPLPTTYSKADLYLIIFTSALFIIAWFIGFSKGTLNTETALKAIAISIGYLYYAWIQHFLAQRYLALRWLKYFKQKAKNNKLNAIKFKAALMTGFIFGVLHIPYPMLILPSMLGGFIYAYYYVTTGRLWAVVISHALVSSAGIFWLLDENPLQLIVDLF